MGLTVACCLWGDWPDPGWGSEYVARLKRGVERNLSADHRFICFSDDLSRVPDGIEARKLDAPVWTGCLPKLYVYAPQAGLEGRVLLFDLDNVITGPLDDMAAYSGDFAVRARLPEYTSGERIADGDMIGFEVGGKAANKLWETFSADPQAVRDATGGRERFFIADTVESDLWQDILPGQVVSYKHHCRKSLPANARVVSCHGRPRPHELTEAWAKDHWR